MEKLITFSILLSLFTVIVNIVKRSNKKFENEHMVMKYRHKKHGYIVEAIRIYATNYKETVEFLSGRYSGNYYIDMWVIKHQNGNLNVNVCNKKFRKDFVLVGEK